MPAVVSGGIELLGESGLFVDEHHGGRGQAEEDEKRGKTVWPQPTIIQPQSLFGPYLALWRCPGSLRPVIASDLRSHAPRLPLDTPSSAPGSTLRPPTGRKSPPERHRLQSDNMEFPTSSASERPMTSFPPLKAPAAKSSTDHTSSLRRQWLLSPSAPNRPRSPHLHSSARPYPHIPQPQNSNP